MCYWNPPAACGEISDDGHSSGEAFCATCCCPCYLLCCVFIYCFVEGTKAATSCAKAIRPDKTYELKQYEWRQKNAPRPLPRRKRRLTLPLQSTTGLVLFKTTQKTLDQHQSPLFSLPYELRRKIWDEIMGYKVIHIGCKEKRLQHTLCSVCSAADYCTGPSATCWPCYPKMKKPYPADSAPQRYGILSLPKTCRQM